MGMAEFMTAVQDLDRLQRLEARLKFHVVEIPESGQGACSTHDTAAQVAEHLKPLIGRRGQVFIFLGERWGITRGALKFLVPPAGAGESLPLFQDHSRLAVDETGSTDLDPAEPEDFIGDRT